MKKILTKVLKIHFKKPTKECILITLFSINLAVFKSKWVVQWNSERISNFKSRSNAFIISQGLHI